MGPWEGPFLLVASIGVPCSKVVLPIVQGQARRAKDVFCVGRVRHVLLRALNSLTLAGGGSKRLQRYPLEYCAYLLGILAGPLSQWANFCSFETWYSGQLSVRCQNQ